MSTNKPRQLIEHISDQYVLSAVNPEQAFAREAEKRKKNHTKILAIACATAAVYVLIIVSILIGNRPDNPSVGPTPGTQGSENGNTGVTPPNQPTTPPVYSEPEINLPDAEFFQKHLSGFWEPEPLQVGDQHVITHYCFNFQSDGRVYIMDWNSSSKDSYPGRYSVTDDHIQIFTFDSAQGWTENKTFQIEIVGQPKQATHLLIGVGDHTFRYKRYSTKGGESVKLQIFDASPSAAIEYNVWDFYIERATMLTHETIDFQLPSQEYFKQLTPLKLESAPAFSLIWADAVSFKLYNRNMRLIAEGTSELDPQTGEFEIDFPNEDGLYYVDLICKHGTQSCITDSDIHFYVAIQVGESKPDEPVTPPTYAEPEINLPSAELFSKHLSAFWTPNMPEGYPLTYLFDFQYDGRVHIVDMNEKTATVGRYSVEGDDIILWTLTEGVGWERSDISVKLVVGEPPTKTKLLVTYDGTTERFVRLNGLSSDSLNIYNSTARPIEVDGAHLYHIEEMAFFGNDPIRFELPTLDVFKEADVVRLSHAPTYLRFSHQHSAEYRVYDKDMNLIADGECRTWPDQTDIPEIDFPEENGRYYLEVIATEEPSGTYYSYLVKHYYAVVEIGEVDEAGEQTDSYTPPAATTDSILIENCDEKPSGLAFALDQTTYAQGLGCWSLTGPASGAIAYHKLTTAIDATGRDVIEFDLYISDLGALDAIKSMQSMCALELSSGGQPDVQEIAFSGEQIAKYGMYGQEWKIGWNHVVLRLSDATATNTSGNGSFDISKINFVRFYLLTPTGEYTVKIDNICLSREAKEGEEPSVPITPPEQPVTPPEEKPTTPPKDTTSPIEIFDCDTLPSYHGNFELDESNMVEGSGCISATVTGRTHTAMDLTFDPVDAEGCDVLEFDLYISDPELFKTGRFFTIELSSSVKQNVAELSFFGAAFFGLEPGLELKQGWNHIRLRLTDGIFQYITEEKFNLRAINHLHIFLIENAGPPNGEYTVKIDNICLSKEVK